ncbi:MAG: 2-amino-4-hydroxy-6-hydroxymethyldihydropteridine diphosphokinase [Planctomycetota bacterium]
MKPETVLVSMGSNLGDRVGHLRFAVAALATRPGLEIVAVSPLFETEAWGGPEGQGAYLNGAVALRCTLEPRELLDLLQDLERRRGRERGERNGPRTLDLDILIFGERRLREPALGVPHPRMLDRAFVLAPAAAVAPDLRHPEAGRTLSELAARVGWEGILGEVAPADWWQAPRPVENPAS